MITALNGVVHGKTIELDQSPGLPDGQKVSVEITTRPEPSIPWWLLRLEMTPTARPGKFAVKGTSILADELLAHVEEGWTEEKLLQTYAGVTKEDIAAVREYAKVPLEMRRCFGAWAADAEELDKFLEWNRQQRKVSHRRAEE